LNWGLVRATGDGPWRPGNGEYLARELARKGTKPNSKGRRLYKIRDLGNTEACVEIRMSMKSDQDNTPSLLVAPICPGVAQSGLVYPVGGKECEETRRHHEVKCHHKGEGRYVVVKRPRSRSCGFDRDDWCYITPVIRPPLYRRCEGVSCMESFSCTEKLASCIIVTTMLRSIPVYSFHYQHIALHSSLLTRPVHEQ